MPEIGTLSESLEDYLEIIYELIQEKRVARVRDIAKRKGVQMASVTGALKRLAKDELVEYSAREFVFLTAEGEQLANRLLQRHRFLKNFLLHLLKVDPEIAEQDACTMEHHLQVETLDRLVGLYEFLTSCPRGGEAILERFHQCAVMQGVTRGEKNGCKHSAKCSIKARKDRLGAITLSELAPGEFARVVQLPATSDRHELIKKCLLPGATISLQRYTPAGNLEVSLGEASFQINQKQAGLILVTRELPT